ncbi:unnamed protein product [Allacma fusca]|uniref:Uncharacterized protein n=1 Tax=Allacma fusca TaxID=39272 RepID=A0A8J2LFF6_9HEXA|nr:unnamed protein product [Allacma fusca]
MSSLAIIVIYPAVCQLALKRRKPSTNNSCRNMNTPASKYPGNTRDSANVNLSAQIVPFLSKSHKSCPNVKNNNVTLNNSNNTCSNNVVINVDSVRDNQIKSDMNFDEESQKCGKEGGESGYCGENISEKKKRNWVDAYLSFLNWRWFTVSCYDCTVSG